jgi:hypothetical protein
MSLAVVGHVHHAVAGEALARLDQALSLDPTPQ